MRKAQITFGLPGLAGLVLFWAQGAVSAAVAPRALPHGNNAQVLRDTDDQRPVELSWGPVGHSNNTQILPGSVERFQQLSWGPVGHRNNTQPVPGSDEPQFQELSWGPVGHHNNTHPVPGLGPSLDDGPADMLAQLLGAPANGWIAPGAGGMALPAPADLLGSLQVVAPVAGGLGPRLVPAPGAGVLLALAALGAGRRRRR